MLEDRALELLQLVSRLDPQPVDECAARVLVGVEGFGLPAGAIERGHQVPAQTLAQRVLGNELLELPDQIVVPPE